MAGMRWLPLESNPEVINKYVEKLGMPVSQWNFTDIFGFDADLLMMVPRPVAAVLLLYPLPKESECELGSPEDAGCSDVYFIKQTIGNACGTIGLLHSLMNNTGELDITGDKHLAKFYAATKDLDAEAKAAYMEKDEELGAAHEDSAQEGQTAAPGRDEKTNFHFICFIHKDGKLYELDGRKGGPVKHGETTADKLLEDTCEVVKKFMARDPDSLNFTMIALSKK